MNSDSLPPEVGITCPNCGDHLDAPMTQVDDDQAFYVTECNSIQCMLRLSLCVEDKQEES